ncbi:RNA polymerase sigma-70 factor (ECF subfamily) [Saccharothrix ecbatanensis]|jgi:RNA polymerase sigma-70 factor (ECF subfamily)|uniref:RNA polymerase sigma-70 factor (ECF subfamily) n=1 Tax=Saccharothrix ecbatanensis TaxID=1105145 RepID=A0A7W9HL66_9PSEU|nr:RNA polymerase sigma factor ShbA [Saccharothrix ecbatanensis]MBB5804347.1 RNA polymerase sigma-70 factor (ECF subfamily) [Saccharothrix ecbatanensis]
MVQHASVRADVEVETVAVRGDADVPGHRGVRLVAVGDPERVTARWLAEADLSELVDEALLGDPRAIGQVLARIQPLVLRYCRARVGSRERTLVSAEDIAQEVCLAVVSALGTYRYEPGSFLAFVYGIAAHKVADARRRAVRSRAEVVPELPDTPALEDGPEQRAMTGEMIGHVTQLLQKLPVRQREILVLRIAVGLSAEETAAAVGSTAGAVRVAQHRALARMREMFAAVNG